jgi:hypothetical protein
MPIRVEASLARCPGCSREIPWQHVRFADSFVCPSCHTRLTVRAAYLRTLNLIAIVISYLLAYVVGLRDWWLLIAGLVGAVPIQTLMLVISVRLFSVEFEATGDVRDILYPADSPSSDATEFPPALETSSIGLRLWQLFRGINQPRSVEGYALQTGVVAMGMFVAWMAVLPVLRTLFPAFDANRSGPKGFPVTVHIGESSLAFTNGSAAFWTCRAELGADDLAGAFGVDAGKTVYVGFATFDPAGTLDASRIRTAAQDEIRLVCVEPSGLSHSALLR